jgi:poly-gamma-glutamate synthesis protein (capsule biosynthesis protein)
MLSAFGYAHAQQGEGLVAAPKDSIAAARSVVLRFAGDCLLADHYESAAIDSPGLAFTGFDLLRSADIAMVNLECPITIRGTPSLKPFTFRMHPRFLPVLKEAGIDIVNVANNHIHDFGRVGLFDTISYLDSIGIKHVGAGRDKSEAHTPVLFEIGGKHLAFLGYYGGGEAPRATRSRAGVATRNAAVIATDIAAIRKSNPGTFVVVNLHWGVEKATRPGSDQIAFAHDIIDAGADLIVGHHPHVLQGVELYKGKAIAYSLGNFIFGGNSRHTYDTAILEVTLSPDGISQRIIPIAVNAWNARQMVGEEGIHIIRQVEQLSRIFPRSIFSHQEVR